MTINNNGTNQYVNGITLRYSEDKWLYNKLDLNLLAQNTIL